MNQATFNKWFSAFILGGMTLAVIFVTIFKLGATDTGKWLLILSSFGSLMGVLSSVLSANAKIITFLFGFIDVSLYGAICLVSWYQGNSGLGTGLLHFIYFVPMQFVGFFQWRKCGSTARSGLKAKRIPSRRRLLLGSAVILLSVVLYLVILKFDKSSSTRLLRWAVVLDVLPLVCNIFGQLLMSMAYVEQWYFWIGVNIFSILMWTRTLSVSSDSSYALVYIIKYSFYLLNSLNGLRIWLRLSRNALRT